MLLLRRFVLVILTWGMFLTAAGAGESMFTIRDEVRQAAFVKALDKALLAARSGNRAAAQTALRQAAFAGGYSLISGSIAPGCGSPAFSMPEWIIWAQSAIGDQEGARETAKYARNAWTTVDLLHHLAQLQYSNAAWREEKFEFYEAIPEGNVEQQHRAGLFRQFRSQKHDYEELKRLLQPRRASEAIETLRMAEPYAQAAARIEDAQLRQQMKNDEMPSVGALLPRFVQFQVEMGDSIGARQTISRIRDSYQKVAALFLLANAEARQKSPEAATFRKQAEKALMELPNPQGRLAIWESLALLMTESKRFPETRQFLDRAQEAAGEIVDLRQRYAAYNLLFQRREMQEIAPHGLVSRQDANDRAKRRQLLIAMRDVILKMPPSPLLSPPQERPQTLERMINLREIIIGFIELQDKTEAERTVSLAKQVFVKNPSESFDQEMLESPIRHPFNSMQ